MTYFEFDAKKTKDDIIRWIRDFFEENGAQCCAVIGISGGKDSSVTAALCTRALGKDRVMGVLMPRGDQYDINSSHELVNHLGIKSVTVNIKETSEAILRALSDGCVNITEQARINTPARLRMAVLYAVAASVNGRVANTCNLSEDYVGYATKFGDGAGDFSPLMNLTVTEVKEIGRELGLPPSIINKTPEDGLCGKTDEDNLGFTYDVLDKYIREGVCENADIQAKIDTMHKQSKHKLEPMPMFCLL